MKSLVSSQEPQEKKQYNQYYSQLITAVACSESKEAFKEIYKEFYPRVKSYLRLLNAPYEILDDLAQEIMGGVWKKAYQYNSDKAAPITWIFTIARNKFIDTHLRKKQHHFTEEDASFFMSDIENPHHHLERINMNNHLLKAVKQLSPEYLELIKMAYFQEKTHREIAETLSIPLGTVKSKLRKSLDMLRSFIAISNFEN